MKIILAAHDRAMLWIDACSQSLAIDKAESAAMLANMCGFRTWDELMSVVGTQAPTPLDELLEPEVLASRRSRYIEVLVDIFGMNPHHASYLASTLSPTSQKTPRTISFDSATMHDPLRDGLIPLIPPGMESMMEEGVEAFLQMMKDSNPQMADFDTSNFFERMRISKPINPRVFYDFCAEQGWDMIESSYRADCIFGQSSFSLISNLGPIPVYINSIAQIPYDSDDEMAEHVRAVVLEDACELNDDPTLILFWGLPLFREVNGKRYTCPGSLHHKGDWHDILITPEMRRVEAMIEKVTKGIDYNNPDPSFEDIKNKSFRTFIALRLGLETVDELDAIQVPSTGSASGWCSPLISFN
jgi:hypothetical protein